MTADVLVDNNVDKALTPRPDPDEWDDPGERSEVTGTAGRLMWGRPADEHFAGAHAAAAALREQRRRGRDVPEATPREPWFDPADEFDYDATVRAIRNREPYSYWDFLEVMKARRFDRLPPAADVDEWREPPGYPGYVLHSISRELWRSPREIELPDGKVRRYQGKKLAARNGSYSLTVNGVTSSRGVNSLYRDTFPEFSKKKKKKTVGEWDDTIAPHVSEFEWAGNEGVAEWLAGGTARIVTRPE